MENLREFIKSRKRNRIYRYSIRRLSIGVVSCVVGAFVLFAPVKFGKAELSGVVYAQNSEKYSDLKLQVVEDSTMGEPDGEYKVILTSASFTQDNNDLKNVKLVVIGDNEKEIELKPDKSNEIIRESKIRKDHIGKEFKIKLINQKDEATYYVGDSKEDVHLKESVEGIKLKKKEEKQEKEKDKDKDKEKPQGDESREESEPKEDETRESDKEKQNKIEEIVKYIEKIVKISEEDKDLYEQNEINKLGEFSGKLDEIQKDKKSDSEKLKSLETLKEEVNKFVRESAGDLLEELGKTIERLENIDKKNIKAALNIESLSIYNDSDKISLKIRTKTEVEELQIYLQDNGGEYRKYRVESQYKDDSSNLLDQGPLKERLKTLYNLDLNSDEFGEISFIKIKLPGDVYVTSGEGKVSLKNDKGFLSVYDFKKTESMLKKLESILEKEIKNYKEDPSESNRLAISNNNKLDSNILVDEVKLLIDNIDQELKDEKDKLIKELLKLEKTKIEGNQELEGRIITKALKLRLANNDDGIQNLKEFRKAVKNIIIEYRLEGLSDGISAGKDEEGKALQEKKISAKKEIEKLKLTSKLKKEFKDKIDKENNKEKIDQIVESAKQLAKDLDGLSDSLKVGKNDKEKELQESKIKVKKLIDNLKAFDQEERDTLKGKVDKASSVEEVNEYYNSAKAVNSFREEKARVNAKEEIDKIKITSKLKKEFKDKIDGANDKEKIDQIVERAKQLAKDLDGLSDGWGKQDSNEAEKNRQLEEIARRDREQTLKEEIERDKQTEKDLENKWQEEANKHKEEQDKKEKPVEPKQPEDKKPEEKPEEPKKPEQPGEKEKEVPAMPLTPGIKVIPSTPLQPSIKVAPRAFRNDNDQRGSIDWRYIKAPSKDAKAEVQKQKTVIEVKIKIGSDILQRTINNHTQEIKMDTKAIIKDGRTMLPIRYVAEALGYTVEWREDTRTAILKDKNTTIEIPVDTNKIIVNGKEIQSDVKPMIENGRTMLPIANIARALGLKDGQDIKWDEAKQEVTIRKEILN